METKSALSTSPHFSKAVGCRAKQGVEYNTVFICARSPPSACHTTKLLCVPISPSLTSTDALFSILLTRGPNSLLKRLHFLSPYSKLQTTLVLLFNIIATCAYETISIDSSLEKEFFISWPKSIFYISLSPSCSYLLIKFIHHVYNGVWEWEWTIWRWDNALINF